MTSLRIFAAAAALVLATGSSAFDVEARCGGAVTVYAAYWCPYCAKTERFLSSRSVAYRRVEVAGNSRVQETMRRRFGTIAVPVVVVGGAFVTGHDEAWLRRALCLR